MSQYLPTRNFVENEVRKRKKDNSMKSILVIKDNHEHGYLKDCALEFPANLPKNKQNFSILYSGKNNQTEKY